MQLKIDHLPLTPSFNSTRCECGAEARQQSRYTSILVNVWAFTGCGCAAFRLCNMLRCSGASAAYTQSFYFWPYARTWHSNSAQSRSCYIARLCVNLRDLMGPAQLHTINTSAQAHTHPVDSRVPVPIDFLVASIQPGIHDLLGYCYVILCGHGGPFWGCIE